MSDVLSALLLIFFRCARFFNLLALATASLGIDVCGQVQNAPSVSQLDAATPLASKDLTYGRKQVDQLLMDRPQLVPVVKPGNEIDSWLVRAFAAPGLGYKLAWSGGNPLPELPSSSWSSNYADERNVSTVWVDGKEKGGLVDGRPRPVENVLSDLVFELNNVRAGEQKAELYRRAVFQIISRDDFIIESARAEYAACGPTQAFYQKIWVPFCMAHQITPTPGLWHVDAPDTFEKLLALYPRTFWYPWGIFGKRYDSFASYKMKDVLAKAEAGDMEAQDQMGDFFYLSRDYSSALSWYLKAAGQGSVAAEKELDWMYENGIGAPENQTQAFSWVLKAATQGDRAAEAAVGHRYEHGEGVKADPVEAKFWYDKAHHGG